MYNNNILVGFAQRLVVSSIKIEKGDNAKAILEVSANNLQPLTSYWLEFSQPICDEIKSLPLYIRVKCGGCCSCCAPVFEEGDCEGEISDGKKGETPANNGCSNGCAGKTKTFLLTKYGVNNIAYGEDMFNFNYPYLCKRRKIYFTNAGRFTLIPSGM